jgi:hypothetical protein
MLWLPTINIHIPCIGRGENCNWGVSITLNVSADSVERNILYPVIVTLPEDEGRSEMSLPMPARSFLMQDSISATAIGVSDLDTGTWLNMPDQTWTRIDSTHYSLTTGIEFDTIPEYLNAL